MTEKELRESLIERYISPTAKYKEQYAGIEVEIPILNINKEPVDFEVVHRLAERFMERFQFEAVNRDADGNVYLAENMQTHDSLSFDCSYNNLEFSLGRVDDLNEAEKRFFSYYRYTQEVLAEDDHQLTGMGINPYRIYNNNVPIPSGRYRMLFHHLHSYPKYRSIPMHFHPYPAFGTFSSASQIQLDVTREELLKTLRAFSRVEPIKALLFSNSLLLGEQEDLICARDMFWENSTHGINPHNVGMYEVDFYSEDELVDYIASTSIYCVERDDKYINFEPVPILQYMRTAEITGEYYDEKDGEYKEISVIPEKADINYLRTFKFEDLTFRGTVEFRSCCCQPIKDVMTVAAFHLGLQTQLDKLDELLEHDAVLYHHGFTANELRHLFVRNIIPPYVNEDELYDLVKTVLDLAREGLVKRGRGEERMLEPLFDRCKKRTNPSKEMLTGLKSGVSIEEMIRAYG